MQMEINNFMNSETMDMIKAHMHAKTLKLKLNMIKSKIVYHESICKPSTCSKTQFLINIMKLAQRHAEIMMQRRLTTENRLKTLT